MKKSIYFVMLFMCISHFLLAQSNMSVQKVVYINDHLDKCIDSTGKVQTVLHCGLFRIYYQCLYILIQEDSPAILYENQSPFCIRFKNSNDTIATYLCDATSNNNDGNTLIWIVAPFHEYCLPYDYEFVAQDIELECNQMPSALQENVELIYHDISSNEYLHLECKNFSAPYYSDEKSVYHQICEYPNDLEDLKKYKMSTKKDVTPTKIDFNMDDFNLDDFDEEQ